jgi:hypothetical protein
MNECMRLLGLHQLPLSHGSIPPLRDFCWVISKGEDRLSRMSTACDESRSSARVSGSEGTSCQSSSAEGSVFS